MTASSKGLTIIELVVVIVVLGLAIPPLLTMWANVAWRSAASELLADSTFYAQQLMEEIKSKNFDENQSPPWTSSASFGPDGAENYPDFDDVDDFNGRLDSPASGFTRSVTIDYIRLSGSAWQACGSVNCAAVSTCANCNECCYKRVTVTVLRSSGSAIPASLTALVSAH